jgi:serine/threonine-protein kinase
MATLMYKIANEPHPVITDIRADIAQKAPYVIPILDRVLEKEVENRYQTGGEFVADLRKCLKFMKKK